MKMNNIKWISSKNLTEDEISKIISAVNYKKETIICIDNNKFLYEGDRVSDIRDSMYYAIINIPNL